MRSKLLVCWAGLFTGGLAAATEQGLLSAAHRDDIAAVRKLLADGADANAASDLGVTALWAASENGNAAMVRLLLASGAEPSRALLAGETPLMVAARGGYLEIVKLLIDRKARVNDYATRKQTALMWAASRKHPEVVRALLDAGADVHARTESWSQMMAVPPHGYPPYNKMIPHGNYTALLFAARSGDLESVRLLVAAGANVNDADAWGVTATTLAAHSGFREIALFLLGKGADPNADRAGFNALHIAIVRRDEELAGALLERGVNPNEPLRTWTPTRRSSKDWHFQPELVGATPYWLAARFSQPGLMRLLLARGADPKFVHRSESVIEQKGYTTSTRMVTAVEAAQGAGGGSAWAPAPPNRDALVQEAIRIATEAAATK